MHSHLIKGKMKVKKARITVKPAGWKGKTVVKECYLADVGHGRLGLQF